MISEQAKQRMRDLADRYPVARSAVMPALYIAQQEEGYITQAALEAVAEAIGLTVDDVESVATFYTMYYQQPPGKKVIKVCTSISCYLRNCDAQVNDEFVENITLEMAGALVDEWDREFVGAQFIASSDSSPGVGTRFIASHGAGRGNPRNNVGTQSIASPDHVRKDS